MQPNREAQSPATPEPSRSQPNAGMPVNQPEPPAPYFPPSSSYSLPLGVSGYVTPATSATSEPSSYPAASPYPPQQASAPPPPGYIPPPNYPPGTYPAATGSSPSGIYMPPSQIYQVSGGYPSQIIRQERQPRNNAPLVVTLILCALLIVVVGGVAFARNFFSNGANSGPNAALVSGNTTTEPTNHHFQVGDQVQIAHTWLMTVNSAQATAGNQVDQQQLKAGDTYLLIDLSVKNMSGSAQDLLGYVSFTVQDAGGKTYPQTSYSGQSVPDGTLAPGEQMHGLLAFEVPAALHHLIFVYDDPAFGAPVLWDVPV